MSKNGPPTNSGGQGRESLEHILFRLNIEKSVEFLKGNI